jgi:hypothetical protein
MKKLKVTKLRLGKAKIYHLSQPELNNIHGGIAGNGEQAIFGTIVKAATRSCCTCASITGICA